MDAGWEPPPGQVVSVHFDEGEDVVVIKIDEGARLEIPHINFQAVADAAVEQVRDVEPFMGRGVINFPVGYAPRSR